MSPIILKTKYAFHSLLWLLKPDVVLDIGSMDGADSKRFRSLLKTADIAAFEANPNNFKLMNADDGIQKNSIRVVNQLVSGKEGIQSFFIQSPDNTNCNSNRGTSSALPRSEDGMLNKEVQINAIRIDSFLKNEYPEATKVAMWVDVEGFAFEVLDSMQDTSDRIDLIHVEVETQECWPGQRLESDVIQHLETMGYLLLAHGENNIQRDLLLVSQSWYNSSARNKIDRMLGIARWGGPTLSRTLSLFPA
ncbi:MAG: FkbM family methyltransferase [Gallionellaceae bacterium]